MKLIEKIPYLLVAGFISLLLYSSCANQGMPTGGPKDSIPPVLLKTSPNLRELNFKGDEVQFTFDEYIISDEVSEILVVSPPLLKRPTIRKKSKTLMIQFNEELRENSTYSLDFKNSIADNNEKNPLKGLRFSFSTGDKYDSLRVAGVVKKAGNLDPVENALVMLYRNLNDSAVTKTVPDYIAKTDKRGIFMIDNIAPGSYRLYSVNDVNTDLKYNEGAEEIAFCDSLIIPSAHFTESPDTLTSGADSLLISGQTVFSPEPVYLLQFAEDIFEQYLISSKRETKYRCQFILAEPADDSFRISMPGRDDSGWFMLEPNKKRDTLNFWITDTLVASLDTFNIELAYTAIDSSGSFYIKKDTLNLPFTSEEPESSKRGRKEKDGPPEIKQFGFETNVKSGFDLNIPVYITAPEPVRFFDTDKVRLYLDEDTTGTPLEIVVETDSAVFRRYKINYKWEPKTSYRFEIDSAACTSIYGVTNQKFSQKFETQKEDYYGRVVAQLKNVPGQVIVQLLKDDKEETLVQSRVASRDGKVTFDFLPPVKLKLRVVYDTNSNGIWDSGSFPEHRQPEKMAYLQKIIKIRSNWDQEETWDITPDNTFPKVIFDQELEEQKQKAKEQKQTEDGQTPTQSGSKSTSGTQRSLKTGSGKLQSL